MDLSHKGFDREGFFDQSASPFEKGNMLHLSHANLFERVLIGKLEKLAAQPDKASCAHIDGALLTSAILFGALVDRRLWSAWIEASHGYVADTRGYSSERRAFAQDITASDPQFGRPVKRIDYSQKVWMELSAPEVAPLRWIADPLTEALIFRWQKFSHTKRRDYTLTPEDPITTIFGGDHWDWAQKDAFLETLKLAAIAKWRMRMPGFLIEALGPERKSVNLPTSSWLAILEPERYRTPLLAIRKPVRKKHRPKYQISGLIHDLLPRGRASSPQEFQEAGRQFSQAADQALTEPTRRLVLMWAADRLDPSRHPKQNQKRLAPSTVAYRGERLLRLLSNSFGNEDPRAYDAERFTHQINVALAQDKYAIAIRNDLICFTAWNCHQFPDHAIKVSKTKTKISGVQADMVPTTAYHAILNRFDKHTTKGAISRILVTLGFRAGLRWQEAYALSVHDILNENGIIELSICNNSDRRLKTATSRQVLPLHHLYEKEELAELVNWWRGRCAQQVPQTFDRNEDFGNNRLFPDSGTLLLDSIRNNIHAEISAATSGASTDFHALRHSFASALIATLVLPDDYRRASLSPVIDPAAISLARRNRLMPALLGEQRHGRDALRAVASLLGHSGEYSTLRSYFHLHDWLAGIYVSRDAVQPVIPTSLASTLLDMSPAEIALAWRKHLENNECRSPLDRVEQHVGERNSDEDFVILGCLVDRDDRPNSEDVLPRLTDGRKSRPISEPSMPSPHALNAVFCAWDDESLANAMLQPELIHDPGNAVAIALLHLLDERTKGRAGVTKHRFVEVSPSARQNAVQRLTSDEFDRLRRLYAGLAGLSANDREAVCLCFRNGYDRARGKIRIKSDQATSTRQILESAGCSCDEIHIETSVRASSVRLGTKHQMDRGFVRALILATASVVQGGFGK